MKIFDAHSDILSDVTTRRLNGESNILKNHHLKKLNKGNVTGSIFVIWVEPEFTEDYEKRTLEIIQSAAKEFTEASSEVKLILKYDDFDMAEKEKKLAIVLGLEGIASLNKNLDNLYILYQYGVRHASLTWNEENNFATGVAGSPGRGLTNYGRETVKLMEKLGMIVDVSHLNEKSFWDVYNTASKPFIASHSNAYSLCGHPRNLKDDQIKAVAQSGGVIGINAWPDFIDMEKPSLEKLLDHIDYMANLVGIEHIGFGFDFSDFLDESAIASFSYKNSIDSFNNITHTPLLINELVKRGYRDADIEKISYGNFMRVLKEII